MQFRQSPWAWVPTLYTAEGFPYAFITILSVSMFKTFGGEMSNASIAFWTSLLGLPWVLKPFWAPFVDIFSTKRRWILTNQLLMGIIFLITGLLIPASVPFLILAMLLLGGAFLSATHDAAADGFYIIALSEHEQAWFSGIRNTFYRIALLAAQGGIVYLIFSALKGQPIRWQWASVFFLAGGSLALLTFYHLFSLPAPAADSPQKREEGKAHFLEFIEAISSFFRKKHIIPAILFLLFYRFAEAQLGKMTIIFMLEPRQSGGLGMNMNQYGMIYGTLGVAALTMGGILGGWLVAKYGFGRTLLPMALLINLPDLVYVYLAWAQPQNLSLTALCVMLEQFGYGAGFTAYMIFMVFYAGDSGSYRTTHYALMTGIMALSLMLPGMVSGWIQENLNLFLNQITGNIWSGGKYELFFLWIMFCTIPSTLTIYLIRPFIKYDFGRKMQ